MIETNRRSFLKGFLALAGTSMVVAPAASLVVPNRPILWGDGVHDDWEAMQAIFDGTEVDIRNDLLRVASADSMWFEGGVFRLSRGLVLSGLKCAVFEGSSLKFERLDTPALTARLNAVLNFRGAGISAISAPYAPYKAYAEWGGQIV